MFEDNDQIITGRFVEIPSSNLGKEHGIGKIIARWGDTIAVDFRGHRGHYTIDKHTIIPVIVGTIAGMDLYADPSVPENEIHIKD